MEKQTFRHQCNYSLCVTFTFTHTHTHTHTHKQCVYVRPNNSLQYSWKLTASYTSWSISSFLLILQFIDILSIYGIAILHHLEIVFHQLCLFCNKIMPPLSYKHSISLDINFIEMVSLLQMYPNCSL